MTQSKLHKDDSSSTQLILCVARPEDDGVKLYVADGLSIGRSMANTIMLAEDETVCRSHAQVHVGADGTAKLCCVELLVVPPHYFSKADSELKKDERK